MEALIHFQARLSRRIVGGTDAPVGHVGELLIAPGLADEEIFLVPVQVIVE
jgi:hypothetical protein